MGFDNGTVQRENIKIEVSYLDIFQTNIPTKLVNTLMNNNKFREMLE